MGFKLQSSLKVSGRARFTLTGVRCVGAEHDVVLILKHAGKGNAGWENAKRKLDAALKARAGAADGDTVIEEVLAPFSQHVVDGWENANDDTGAQIAPTAANVEALLRFVIDDDGSDIVDQAISYALARANFRDYMPPKGAADLGKG